MNVLYFAVQYVGELNNTLKYLVKETLGLMPRVYFLRKIIKIDIKTR